MEKKEQAMRRLIELSQENLVECDNPLCDYVIKNETKDPNTSIIEYLNKPCPECGENLLTERDYLQAERVMKIINWLNKYFSWIMLFSGKKPKMTEANIKVHDGIKIHKK